VHYVVPGSQLFLLCLSYTVHPFQYNRVGISSYTKTAPGHYFAHGIFMVCVGDMVRLGILLLYRMALRSTQAPWVYRPNQVVYPFPDFKTHGLQCKYATDGTSYSLGVYRRIVAQSLLYLFGPKIWEKPLAGIKY